jgi:hypothetical protein
LALRSRAALRIVAANRVFHQRLVRLIQVGEPFAVVGYGENMRWLRPGLRAARRGEAGVICRNESAQQSWAMMMTRGRHDE